MMQSNYAGSSLPPIMTLVSLYYEFSVSYWIDESSICLSTSRYTMGSSKNNDLVLARTFRLKLLLVVERRNTRLAIKAIPITAAMAKGRNNECLCSARFL